MIDLINSANISNALAAVRALIFSLMTCLRLVAKPNLLLCSMNENPDQDLLTSFKLIIKNRGKKSAEDVTIWLQIHKGSGIEIKPIGNHVEITDRDSLWKGVIFEYPAWDGPEQCWRLVQTSVHPHQGIPIGEVFVHPDWPRGGDRNWTFINWNIFAKDTPMFSGKIRIPVHGRGIEIWGTRN